MQIDKAKKIFGNASKEKKVLYALLLICIFIRILLWLAFTPTVFADSGAYIWQALAIVNADFSLYDGGRTPVYPLVIVLFGLKSWKGIWLIQSLIGISISIILYKISLRQTKNIFLSFSAGLLHSLLLNELFFEGIILTETLATFLVALSIWLFLEIRHATNRHFLYYAAFGTIVALAGLIRPLFLFLPPFFLLFLFFECAKNNLSLQKTMKYLAGYSLPVITIIFSWCLCNYHFVKYFGPTTLVGYNLTQHSGAFIEKAPDEYSDIKKIYSSHKDEWVKEHGSHEHLIWVTLYEMQKTTGLSFGELSSKLTKMSIQLFIKYPHLYIKSVLKAWVKFWGGRIYWLETKEKTTKKNTVLKIIWQIQKTLIRTASLLFLAISLYWLFGLFKKRRLDNISPDALIVSLILCTSIIQALTENGDNSRFIIPVQSLMIYIVLVGITNFYLAKRQKRIAGFPIDKKNLANAKNSLPH